jgi:hypothetical protein
MQPYPRTPQPVAAGVSVADIAQIGAAALAAHPAAQLFRGPGPNTAGYARDAVDQVQSAYGQGGVPAAAGMAVRSAIGAPVAVAHDAVNSVVDAVAPIVRSIGQFGKTLVTGDPTPIGGPGAVPADRGATSAAKNVAPLSTPAPTRASAPATGPIDDRNELRRGQPPEPSSSAAATTQAAPVTRVSASRGTGSTAPAPAATTRAADGSELAVPIPAGQIEMIRGLSRTMVDPRTGVETVPLPAGTDPLWQQAANLAANRVTVPAQVLSQQFAERSANSVEAKRAAAAIQVEREQQAGANSRTAATEAGANARHADTADAVKAIEARKALAAAKTPEEREKVMRRYGLSANTKHLMNTEKLNEYDANGLPSAQVPHTIIWDPDAGKVVYETPNGSAKRQAPAAALEMLRKNPNLKADFQKKYGYLPPGFAYGGLVDESEVNRIASSPDAVGDPNYASNMLQTLAASRAKQAAQTAAATAGGQMKAFAGDYAANKVIRKAANAGVPSDLLPGFGQGYAEGGVVQGPGTGTSDSIPARVNDRAEVRLSDGEFIIPADVVKTLGAKTFDQIIRNARSK